MQNAVLNIENGKIIVVHLLDGMQRNDVLAEPDSLLHLFQNAGKHLGQHPFRMSGRFLHFTANG